MSTRQPATKILIIEDNKANSDLLKEYLLEDGFKSDAVYNGNDALQALKKNPYDIALIDINLPDHDGIELIDLIQEIVPDILFAMITGLDSVKKATRAFKKGAFGYFVKPFIMEDIFHGLREVLEKKDLQCQLRLSQSQIIQQERMAVIGQLAAGVAHEINNPVGFINSNLSTLVKYIDRLTEFIQAQDTVIGEQTESDSNKNLSDLRKKLKIDFLMNDIGSLLSESLEGTDRIKNIVQDLKLFSRQDAEKKTLAYINDSIESALNIVKNDLKYKATIQKDFGEQPITLCYPQKLSQVFMNILVNAGQALEQDGEITIRSWHENTVNRVTISDNGMGMPKSMQARVFDPFYTTKDPGKGTGLGLSIAAEIIQKHGGTIEIESQVGKGSTFRINLPVINDE